MLLAGGIVLTSLGGVSLVVSAITGAMFLSETSTVDDHCDANNACDETGLSAVDNAATLGTVNGVTFVGGLLAAATGCALIVVWASSDDEGVSAAIGPAGVSLTGHF